MKKIISVLCLFAMIFATLPIATINVSADDNAWKNWTFSGGAKVEDGILYMSGDGAYAYYSSSGLPDKYVMSFSMRVNVASSSMGLQGGNGSTRAGFYFTSAGGRAMDDAEVAGVWPKFNISNIGQWHDYRMEVDHLALTEKLYVDDVLIADFKLKKNNISQYQFWCLNNGNYEVSDFSMDVPKPEIPEIERTMEYTEPFFVDFVDGPEGWRVESEPYVTHNKEEGTLRLKVYQNTSYRSIERPLTTTTNYDIEFRLRFPEIPEDPQIAPGAVWISLSTKQGHTWTNIEDDRIIFWDEVMETNTGTPLVEHAKGSVYYKREHDKWQTWRAEVRGGHMSWFIDGKKLVSFPLMTKNALNWNAAAIWITNGSDSQLADVEVDWVKYQPYFDDELSLEYPHNKSVYSEGGDILIQAKTPSDAEKIDYYVNNVLVGSGTKATGYKYVLKNAKAGTYKIKAKLENIETAEVEYMVKKKIDSAVVFDKNEVYVGESVNAVANVDAIGEIDRVEFYVDGDFYATDNAAPYSAVVTATEAGTSAIRAKVFTESGSYAESEDAIVKKTHKDGTPFKTSREYEINYDYDGNSGSIDIKDGYFNLNLNHSGDRLTYKTTEGSKVYEGLKSGSYKVIVTAGYGELYWNNQFVFSFRMPYAPSEQSKASVGLKNVKIGGSGVKTTYVNIPLNGQSKIADESVWNNQYYSIEFDKKDSSPETLIFNDGIFTNSLYFREDGLYVRHIFTPAHEPSERKLTDAVEPGYYRITVAYGVAIVNLNNKPIGEYRLVQEANLPRIERTMTNPSSSTFVAVKNSDDVYYHYDNFEDVTEYPSTEYWAPNNTYHTSASTDKVTAERKADSTGNHYMSIRGTGTYMLNAIDLNPTFRWRGKVDSKAGKVYLMFRRSYDNANSKIGYDFESQEWFMEHIDANGVFYNVTRLYDPDAFKTGQWYDFELKANDYDVALVKDGKVVVSAQLPHLEKIMMYGRVGFGLDEGSYCFDDVVYEGKNRVTPGFSFTSGGAFGRTETNTAASFYKDADGNIVATGLAGTLVSKDKGKTWGELVLKTDTDTKGRIFEEQMVVQPDGTFVKINPRYSRSGYHTAEVSKDGGKNWTAPVNIADATVYGHIGAVSRSTVSMDGRIFYSPAMGYETYGCHYIFYSDDGITWTKSETDLNTKNTGVIMNELIVVDTPRENEVWAYARSDTGFIVYWKSFDNGKTFDLTPHYTNLLQSACCYRIVRDWNNPNTYYALFNYEATDISVRHINFPRTRTSIAVSYDGMETWEYATDLFEGSLWGYGRDSSDGIIKIIDDTLFWKTNSWGNAGAGTNFGAIDVTKLKSLKRFPQIHQRTLQGFEFGQHGAIDGCAIPKSDGTMWAYNGFYPVKVSDGRVDSASAKRIFGVEAVQSGNTVTLTIGDAKIVLTEGSDVINVNGEEKKAERAALSGGMVDLKSLCSVFGKDFAETESAYTVMMDDYIEKYQTMLNLMAK